MQRERPRKAKQRKQLARDEENDAYDDHDEQPQGNVSPIDLVVDPPQYIPEQSLTYVAVQDQSSAEIQKNASVNDQPPVEIYEAEQQQILGTNPLFLLTMSSELSDADALENVDYPAPATVPSFIPDIVDYNSISTAKNTSSERNSDAALTAKSETIVDAQYVPTAPSPVSYSNQIKLEAPIAVDMRSKSVTMVDYDVVSSQIIHEAEQVQYANPHILSQQYVHQVFQEIYANKEHPWYVAMAHYYRASMALYDFMVSSQKSREAAAGLSEKIWILQKRNITETGTCGDQRKVSHQFHYEYMEFNSDGFGQMRKHLSESQETFHQKLAQAIHAMNDAKLKAQLYLDSTLLKSSLICSVTVTQPVAFNPAWGRTPEQLSDAATVRQLVGILFLIEQTKVSQSFHARVQPEYRSAYERTLRVFYDDVRKWLSELVGILLRIATHIDHQYIVLNLLQCPGSVFWGSDFVHFPVDWTYDSCQFILSIFYMVVTWSHKRICEHDPIFSKSPHHMPQSDEWVVLQDNGQPSPATIPDLDVIHLLRKLPLFQVNSCLVESCKTTVPLATWTWVFQALESEVHQVMGNIHHFIGYPDVQKLLLRDLSLVVTYAQDIYLQRNFLPPAQASYVQRKYDRLFLQLVQAILSAPSTAALIYLTDLPFHSLSVEAAWGCLQLLYISSDTPVPSLLTSCQGWGSMWTVKHREVFAKNVTKDANCLNILQSLAALAMKQSDDVAVIVSVEFLALGYFNSDGNKLYYKDIAIFLSDICLARPFIITRLLNFCHTNSKSVEGDHPLTYAFSNLPLSRWVPTETDMETLVHFLCQDREELQSLAMVIVDRTNMGCEEPLEAFHHNHEFLVVSVDKQVILAKGLMKARKAPQKIRRNDTISPKFDNWTWKTVLRLTLHPSAPHEIMDRTSNTEVYEGIEQPNTDPFSAYLALQLIAHHEAQFCSQRGEKLAQCLISTKKIHAYARVLMDAVQFKVTHVIQALLSPAVFSSVIKSRQMVHWSGHTPWVVTENSQTSSASPSATVEKDMKTSLEFISNVLLSECALNAAQIEAGQISKAILELMFKGAIAIPQALNSSEIRKLANETFYLPLAFSLPFDFLSPVQEYYLQQLQARKQSSRIAKTVRRIFKSSACMNMFLPEGVKIPLDGTVCPEIGDNWCLVFYLLHAQTKLQQDCMREIGQSFVTNPSASIKDILQQQDSPYHYSELSIFHWAVAIVSLKWNNPIFLWFCQMFFALYFSNSIQQGKRIFHGKAVFEYERMRNLRNSLVQYLRSISSGMRADFQEQLVYDGPIAKIFNLINAMVFWLEIPNLSILCDTPEAAPPTSLVEQANKLIAEGNPKVPEEMWLNTSAAELTRADVLNRSKEFLKGLELLRVHRTNKLHTMATSKPPQRPEFNQTPSAAPGFVLNTPPDMRVILEAADAPSKIRILVQILSNASFRWCEKASRLVATDEGYLELLRTLFYNRPAVSTFHKTCSSDCRSAAAIHGNITEIQTNERSKEAMVENRKQLEAVLVVEPPSFSECVATNTLENTISLICNSNQYAVMQIAIIWYHTLLEFDTEQLRAYAPARDYVHRHISILGTKFITQASSEQMKVLDLLLGRPQVFDLIYSHFNPAVSLVEFSTMFQKTVLKEGIPEGQKAVLLGKFDINSWMKAYRPSSDELLGMLRAAMTALTKHAPSLRIAQIASVKDHSVWEIIFLMMRFLIESNMSTLYARFAKWVIEDSLAESIQPETVSLLLAIDTSNVVAFPPSVFSDVCFSIGSTFASWTESRKSIYMAIKSVSTIIRQYFSQIFYFPTQVDFVVYWAGIEHIFGPLFTSRMVGSNIRLEPWVPGDPGVSETYQTFVEILQKIARQNPHAFHYLWNFYHSTLSLRTQPYALQEINKNLATLPWENFTISYEVANMSLSEMARCEVNLRDKFHFMAVVIPRVIIKYFSDAQAKVDVSPEFGQALLRITVFLLHHSPLPITNRDLLVISSILVDSKDPTSWHSAISEQFFEALLCDNYVIKTAIEEIKVEYSRTDINFPVTSSRLLESGVHKRFERYYVSATIFLKFVGLESLSLNSTNVMRENCFNKALAYTKYILSIIMLSPPENVELNKASQFYQLISMFYDVQSWVLGGSASNPSKTVISQDSYVNMYLSTLQLFRQLSLCGISSDMIEHGIRDVLMIVNSLNGKLWDLTIGVITRFAEQNVAFSLYIIRVICQISESAESLALILERLCEIYLEDTQSWVNVLEKYIPPELSRADYLDFCSKQGLYLNWSIYFMHKMFRKTITQADWADFMGRLRNTLVEKRDPPHSIAKANWQSKMILLCIVGSFSILQSPNSIRTDEMLDFVDGFCNAIQRISLDRIGEGFLGISFSKEKSHYTPNQRSILRCLVTFMRMKLKDTVSVRESKKHQIEFSKKAGDVFSEFQKLEKSGEYQSCRQTIVQAIAVCTNSQIEFSQLQALLDVMVKSLMTESRFLSVSTGLIS
eukprot:TRINITY_DN4007_c0_g1_i3.p1 TRINITY_DN4007_c0_g1~~TRINITY_DN4007_c0_g1_i3.p1  ORF type:complete len:2472 (+),score=386.83 TRINITY_DN4007_c0_g1_i3:49-7464(+)